MGFSWALHFAQAGVQEVVRRASPDTPVLREGAPPPAFESGLAAAMIYVDNLPCLGIDSDRVQRHADVLKRELGEHGWS